MEEQSVTELKLDTTCCGKPMFKDTAYINGTDITNFVCLECGNFLHIAEEQLDEELVDGYREMAKRNNEIKG